MAFFSTRLFPSKLSVTVEGALWMVTAAALFSVLNLLIRHASTELHPFQVTFFRNFFSLAFMLPWLMRAGLGGLRTRKWGLYSTRALTGLAAMLTWFYAISVMPLAEAVALNFTTPLFATVGAALFLGEVVRLRRWTATVVGFLGVLVIVRPDADAIDLMAVLVLVSACFSAASALQVKALARTESTTAMVTYMVLFLTPMSLVPALFVWSWPSWGMLVWLVATIVFLAIYLVPGDPAELLLSQGGAAPDPAIVEDLRDQLGLNRPVLEQYLHSMAGLLRGDLGYSMMDGAPIAGEIATRLPRTLELIGAAALISVLVGVSTGTLAAVGAVARVVKDALVVDNTGRWRDDEGLSQHLQAKGAAKVLLTAPGKGEMKNIVFGVNSDDITPQDTIVSAASCTTNGITPVLKVIQDDYGIDHGHVETVHAYTNDQNLVDNFHKGARRGRAAGMNMVLTETGAAKAVAKALPELKGKLSGNAIRVPTPDVSMAILNLELNKATSVEELNARLKQESLTGPLRGQVGYVDSPEVVSTDFVGSDRAGVVDGLATLVNNDGKNAILYVWYDNEYGYSHQVIRVVEKMAGQQIPAFPQA